MAHRKREALWPGRHGSGLAVECDHDGIGRQFMVRDPPRLPPARQAFADEAKQAQSGPGEEDRTRMNSTAVIVALGATTAVARANRTKPRIPSRPEMPTPADSSGCSVRSSSAARCSISRAVWRVTKSCSCVVLARRMPCASAAPTWPARPGGGCRPGAAPR